MAAVSLVMALGSAFAPRNLRRDREIPELSLVSFVGNVGANCDFHRLALRDAWFVDAGRASLRAILARNGVPAVCGMPVGQRLYLSRSRTSTLEEVQHQGNHRDDQEKVNEPTGNAERESSQQPQYEQDYEDR
jgi:hypothetical protein